MSESTGWHFHTTWPKEAWRDEGCPDPKRKIPIPESDDRVQRVLANESTLRRAQPPQ